MRSLAVNSVLFCLSLSSAWQLSIPWEHPSSQMLNDSEFNAYKLNSIYSNDGDSYETAFYGNFSIASDLPNWPSQRPESVDVLLTWTPGNKTNRHLNGNFLASIFHWMSQAQILTAIPVQVTTVGEPDLPDGELSFFGNSSRYFSNIDDCNGFYTCIYDILAPLAQSDFSVTVTPNFGAFEDSVRSCLTSLYAGSTPLVCPIRLLEVNSTHDGDCDSDLGDLGDLSQFAWQKENVDLELSLLRKAGPDTHGIWWPRLQYPFVYALPGFPVPNETRPFTTTLGAQALGDSTFTCSLEVRCSSGLDCQRVGSRTALGYGAAIYPEAWPYLLLLSLENLSNQLSNQYTAIKGASISAILVDFKISDFYQIDLPSYSLLDVLQGLGLIFALLSGFVAGFGATTLAGASAAVGAVGGYLGRYLSNTTRTTAPQEQYADVLENVYVSLKDGLENLSTPLFDGEKIYGDFDIFEMLKGGAWVDRSALQPIAESEEQLRIEIISRSINELWKTPPHNKTFVLFVDLHDTVDSTANCRADSSGPPSMKYCADGGVYYAYTLVDDKGGQVYLDWPHGAKTMKTEIDIDPAVKQSPSASSIMWSPSCHILSHISYLACTYNLDCSRRWRNVVGPTEC